jgi:hypothetical protein
VLLHVLRKQEHAFEPRDRIGGEGLHRGIPLSS